jgi:hypothetical protein
MFSINWLVLDMPTKLDVYDPESWEPQENWCSEDELHIHLVPLKRLATFLNKQSNIQVTLGESDAEFGVDAIWLNCFVKDELKGLLFSSDYDIDDNESYYLHYGEEEDEFHGYDLEILKAKLYNTIGEHPAL